MWERVQHQLCLLEENPNVDHSQDTTDTNDTNDEGILEVSFPPPPEEETSQCSDPVLPDPPGCCPLWWPPIPDHSLPGPTYSPVHSVDPPPGVLPHPYYKPLPIQPLFIPPAHSDLFRPPAYSPWQSRSRITPVPPSVEGGLTKSASTGTSTQHKEQSRLMSAGSYPREQQGQGTFSQVKPSSYVQMRQPLNSGSPVVPLAASALGTATTLPGMYTSASLKVPLLLCALWKKLDQLSGH